MSNDVAWDFWPVEVLSRQLEEGGVHTVPWVVGVSTLPRKKQKNIRTNPNTNLL